MVGKRRVSAWDKRQEKQSQLDARRRKQLAQQEAAKASRSKSSATSAGTMAANRSKIDKYATQHGISISEAKRRLGLKHGTGSRGKK